MKFMSEKHQERFEMLMKKGNIRDWDKERYIPMYIFSGNDDLFRKVDDLFDFKKGIFKLHSEVNENGETERYFRPLSTSEKNLTWLAFDIFSGESNISVYRLFNSLDSNNRRLALLAIEQAFN